MISVYLLGATHLGRELESAIDNSPIPYKQYSILGYLHKLMGDSPLDKYPSDYTILGSWEDYPLDKSSNFILAVADPHWKKILYDHLAGKCNLISFVHYTARIGKFCQIAEGSLVTTYSVISTNVKLGKAVFVNGGSQVGHDVVIGDYTTLYSRVQVGGGCQIGSNVVIGSCATILPGIKIGDGATIGTGSVVIRNVKPGVTVFGNPAKRL